MKRPDLGVQATVVHRSTQEEEEEEEGKLLQQFHVAASRKNLIFLHLHVTWGHVSSSLTSGRQNIFLLYHN